MLDKTKKIIYIIVGTLTIVTLVFGLMKKVGLCASSGGINYLVLPSDYDTLPFPIVNYSPIPNDVIEHYVSEAYSSGWSEYLNPDWYFFISDYDNNYYIVRVATGIKLSFSSSVDEWSDFFDSSYSLNYDVDGGVQFTINKSDFSEVSREYRGSDFSKYYNTMGESSPSGGRVLVPDTIYTGYILASNVESMSIYSGFGSGTVFYQVPSDNSLINFEEGSVTALPSLDPLSGSPDPSDSSDTLFGKLKGWLSTIQGNIYNGFKNLEENLTSFFKPYLDNIKNFFGLLTDKDKLEDFVWCDHDRAMEIIEDSEVGSTVLAFKDIGDNIFGIVNATPSDHVYWTFDFTDTILEPCGTITVNFDWYDRIRNVVTPLFCAFFYVGMLLLIIRKIPGIISGASSNSDDK